MLERTVLRVLTSDIGQDILEGKYQQVLVSPEIAISREFSQRVLSRREFTDHLCCVCIDEAHCINIWGGGFRPDYAELGVLRGRLPRNVPFLIASATLPPHVLDDIRSKLQLSERAQRVAVSNDRPNIALSVRTMKFSEESKVDLRFLIPENARTLEDIPITAVYCNDRPSTEDICDHLRQWATDAGIEDVDEGIVFYHAHIGSDRKREIERRLRKGRVRIIVCTDAVGMVRRRLSAHQRPLLIPSS